jgi:DNA topoisomerase-6 subunit B
VGKKTALKIIEFARKQSDRQLSDRSYPAHIAHAQAAALHRAIQKTRILAPRTDCIVPIGEKALLEGLHKKLEAAFYTGTTRPAAAYRGNPFQVEVAIAYGHPGEADVEVDAGGHMRRTEAHETSAAEHLIAQKDEPVRLLRFANRVPLL